MEALVAGSVGERRSLEEAAAGRELHVLQSSGTGRDEYVHRRVAAQLARVREEDQRVLDAELADAAPDVSPRTMLLAGVLVSGAILAVIWWAGGR